MTTSQLCEKNGLDPGPGFFSVHLTRPTREPGQRSRLTTQPNLVNTENPGPTHFFHARLVNVNPLYTTYRYSPSAKGEF